MKKKFSAHQRKTKDGVVLGGARPSRTSRPPMRPLHVLLFGIQQVWAIKYFTYKCAQLVRRPFLSNLSRNVLVAAGTFNMRSNVKWTFFHPNRDEDHAGAFTDGVSAFRNRTSSNAPRRLPERMKDGQRQEVLLVPGVRNLHLRGDKQNERSISHEADSGTERNDFHRLGWAKQILFIRAIPGRPWGPGAPTSTLFLQAQNQLKTFRRPD